MGSILSGRHRTTSRGVVEQAKPLDIRRLKRVGFIQPGRLVSGVMSWKMRGEHAGDFEIAIDLRDPNFPRAEVRLVDSRSSDGSPQRINLTSSPCRLGGRRYYLACPITGRRCVVLYSRGGAFASRQAHGLVYQAQSEDALGRLRRAVARSRERALGLRGKPRPRGANRARLIAEWSACETAYDSLFASESVRRFGFEAT